MFTKTQGQELIDNTTSEWTTINGVNGRKFINKSDSNKYIFLPAGGTRNESTTTFPNPGKVRRDGNYWDSTLYLDQTTTTDDFGGFLYLQSNFMICSGMMRHSAAS